MIVTYEPSKSASFALHDSPLESSNSTTKGKLGPSATTTHTMKQIEDLARAAINQAIRNHCSLLSIKADLEVSMRACESEARRNVFELSFYDKALQITKGKFHATQWRI